MKKFISSIVAATVVSTAAFGASSISPSGLGDFLIAPGFFSQVSNGKTFSTDLKVVNTSDSTSVILRGVLRDALQSEEVDFVILLSPGDVWKAKIAPDATGQSRLTSDDDSNYGIYSSKYNRKNLDVALKDFSTNHRDFKAGYVEFFPIIAYDERNQSVVLSGNMDKPYVFSSDFINGASGYKLPYYYDTASNKIIQTRPYPTYEATDKNVLAQRFESLVYGGGVNTKFTSGLANTIYTALLNGNGDVPNILTGEVTVTSSLTNSTMTIPMLAIRDASLEGNVTHPKVADQIVARKDFIAPTLASHSWMYLNDFAQTRNMLSKDSINLTYDNSGKNSSVVLAFWDDQAANQARRFAVDVRNNSECMCDCAPVMVLDCPSCDNNATMLDPVSGGITTNKDRLYCAYDVTQEFSTVDVANLLATPYKCDVDQKWNEGWIQLHSVQFNSNVRSPAIIPTQMSADRKSVV